MNISRHAVGVCDLVGPVPGELMAPLTQRVEDVSAGGLQCLTHQLEPLLVGDRASLKAAAVIVFEIVNPPGCVGVGIEFLITPASWVKVTVVDARIAKRENSRSYQSYGHILGSSKSLVSTNLYIPSFKCRW